MAYIGAEPLPGQNREVDDISSSFNGSTTAFTLQVSGVNVSPESANNILVNIGGVIQNPGTDYTIAASTITFTTAPASGLSFFALILGAGINTATVADDTIGPSKLIDTAVTAGSYTTADITVDAQGRITAAASGTISGAEIADQAVTNAKVNNSAAIAGTKISPDFGSQNVVTTGSASIGIASPDSKLHVFAGSAGSISAAGSAVITLEKNADTALQFLSPSSNIQEIRFGDESDNGSGYIQYSHASNFLSFGLNGGSEKIRIDSSGNVGIGTTSPQGSMHLKSMSGVLSVDTYPQLTIETSATDGGAHKGGGILFLNHNGNAGTFGGSIQCLKENATVGNTANYIRFSTRPAGGSVTERMRINSSGDLLIATNSTTVNSSNFGIAFFADHGAAIFKNTDGPNTVVRMGGNQGLVKVQGDGDLFNTNNTYGQVSDETLKQDIVDAASQWNDIKNLRVRKFRFKDNPTGVLQIGVIAQEIEKVSAGLVQEDDEGIKSVKYSVLYMKAIKALQEAITKIETLETKVAALEAA